MSKGCNMEKNGNLGHLELIRKINRTLILNMVKEKQPISRAQISKALLVWWHVPEFVMFRFINLLNLFFHFCFLVHYLFCCWYRLFLSYQPGCRACFIVSSQRYYNEWIAFMRFFSWGAELSRCCQVLVELLVEKREFFSKKFSK